MERGCQQNDSPLAAGEVRQPLDENDGLAWLAGDVDRAHGGGPRRGGPLPLRYAVGQTVILLTPPSTFGRCINIDGEGMPVK